MRCSSILLALALVASAPVASAHEAEPPRPKTSVNGVWPAGRAGAYDVVVPVVMVVGIDGRVESAEVEVSLGADLDAAALDAARRWVFEPALRDGKPIAARIRAAVRFVAAAEEPHVHAEPEHPSAHDHEPHEHEHDHPHEAAPPPPSEPAAPEEVRVSGRVQPRSASEVVRGRDVLAAAPHRTASDMLTVIPGVFVTQHSGEGKAHQIFLRGFDAVHGQDLEIWVAGAPVNEVSNIHGQGYADLHVVMPEVVKEVHALPGTYDPRQGDFAVAGTIRYKLGFDDAGITTKATAGSFGARRVFLAYHPAGAPDATFAAFETYATDGFGPARAAMRASAIGQVSHDFEEDLSLRVMASTFTSRFDSAGVLLRDDVERGKVDRFATYDAKQGGYSARTQLVVELHKHGDGDRWSIAPYAVLRSLGLRSNFTGFTEDPVNGDNTQQLNDAVTVGTTAFYRKSFRVFSSDDALEAGLALRHDRVTQSQRRLSNVTDSPTATLVDARIRATDVGAYLDASLKPLSRLRVRGGLRVDGLSYASQDFALSAAQAAHGETAGEERVSQGVHFGKKATIEWAAIPKLRALVSYGEGFRSPQARSLVNGQTTPFTTVTSYEAGVRYAEGEALQGSVAVFHTRLSDDLVFDQTTARNERVPATHRTGVSIEMVAKPTPSFLASSSLTYTRAEFAEGDGTYNAGDLLPYVPQIVARSDVAYTPAFGHWLHRKLEGRFGVGLTSFFHRPLPYGETGHDVFLTDAGASVRLGEIELGVDAFNLLGTDWYDGEFVYASSFRPGAAAALVPARHVTVGTPRSLFASLTLRL
jgi:TonB family protein